MDKRKIYRILGVIAVIVVLLGIWSLSRVLINSTFDRVDSTVSQLEKKQKDNQEEEEEQITYEKVPLSEDESWKGSYEETILVKARSIFDGLDSVSLDNTSYEFVKDDDGNSGVTLGVYTMYYDERMSLLYIAKSEPFTDEEKVYLDPSNGNFYTFYEEEGKYIFTTK